MEETSVPEKSFAAMALATPTRQGIEAKGYVTPTDVQAETIPKALAGRDLVVQSRTGTGKTAAFGIPIVELVSIEQMDIQAVILAPTRELALQVSEEVSGLGKPAGLRVEVIYGGDSMDRQLQALAGGVHVVVGTPGRVLDHLRRGTLRFDKVRMLVLDEADRMLDMGFAVEMGQIMEYMPAERQTLLFSATVPLGIRGLIYHYMAEPEWVLLSEDQVYVKEVEHVYCLTPRLHKEATLYRLLELENPVSSMIFCNTREETRYVHSFLEGRGLPSAMLSSDLPQKSREKVLAALRDGRIKNLVTTDVASRGIDIEDLSHVFIFSTPDSPEQYIHRAGRTGRVGRSGRAISLLSAHDLVSFNRLVKRYKIEVKEIAVPSDEEVQARKTDRIVSELADDAMGLSVEEFMTFGPAARSIAAHEKRDRIVALLVKRALAPAKAAAEAKAPLLELEPPAEGQGGGERRRRRSSGPKRR